MGVFDGLVGGAITGVANVATSLINRHSQKETNKTNARINEANNKFNAEQSKLQRDWSAEQAELARDFDTSERLAQQEWQERMADPRLQMQKWLAAGLSPNTFNGDMSVGSANGSSVGIPSGSAASAAPPIGMRAPTLDLDMSQTALNLAQAKAIRDANNRENEKQGLVLETAKLQLEVMGSQINLNEALTESEKQKIEESGKRIAQMDAEIEHTNVVTELASLEGKEKHERLKKIQEFISLELAQKRASLNLTKEQCNELASQITLNFANAANAESQALLNDQQTANLGQVHFLNGVQIKAIQGHESELASYIWDDTKGTYKLSIDTNTKEGRKAHFRSKKTFLNNVLNATEIVGESVGSALKGFVHVGIKP